MQPGSALLLFESPLASTEITFVKAFTSESCCWFSVSDSKQPLAGCDAAEVPAKYVLSVRSLWAWLPSG